MRLVFKIFLAAGLVLMVLIPAGLVLMIIDPDPHVRITDQISQDDIRRARQVLNRLKPENPDRHQVKSLVVSAKELNLLLGYGLKQAMGTDNAAAQIHLFHGVAIVYATIQIPENFLGKWINAAMVVKPHPGTVEIRRAQIGRLPVPAPLAQWLAGRIHTRLMTFPRYAGAVSMAKKIQAIAIEDDQLALHFQWDPEIAGTLAAEAKKQLFSQAQQKRLAVYHNHLVELSRSFQGKHVSLIHFMKPMFMLALENTALSRDPVAENTAVVQVLAAHVMGRDLAGYLVSEIRATLLPSRPDVVFQLMNREDMAQHFLVSAAITMLGSSRLAGSMGLAKEMDDARAGSGFSFADMAANTAGVKMGRFAVSGPVNARILQKRMASLSHETDFMPDISNLPENMGSDEFNTRFTDTRSAGYARVMDLIESRLASCRIYQN
ncbi:MAG: hypothetical protein K9K21_04735 [Desulfotignum sp.]|nr:hypothetical protein [Desulfotignum sp.]MCF8113145.1 hypothetical protein [Desulfotignum sp.]MCF8125840.1 hypothetical protein [Desulfotignum sp.]